MSTSTVADFVAALPKVELHLHLVGSASLDTVLTLARRHPDGGVPTELDALRRFYTFTDFPHFLDVYRQVNLLVTAADVVTLVTELAADLAARTVRYAEVQVTPVRHRMGGVDYDDLAQALVDGRTFARERHGVELGWVFDTDAILGPAGAEETVDFAVGHRPEGTVGIGLGGSELGISRADFAPAFHRAVAAGLHSVPHAGETVGPGEIWAAVTELGAERIGHGIAAAQDPRLLEYLAAHHIPLEVCPTSNLLTGAAPSLAAHPLPALVAAGVPVTLATDDPGMFQTDLDAEYRLCHDVFGMGIPELAEIARTGARAAFCSDELRTRILAEIDAVETAAA
jgi:aminodeoxyfutalosine deaminase